MRDYSLRQIFGGQVTSDDTWTRQMTHVLQTAKVLGIPPAGCAIARLVCICQVQAGLARHRLIIRLLKILMH